MYYLLLFIFLFSCSSHLYQESAHALHHGRFEEAEKQLAKADLPYTRTNDSPLLLLSRAMVYFQSGQMVKSLLDFEKALDASDYYQQRSVPEIAGQTLLQDDIGAYVPPPFEQQLTRFYQALAFLHRSEEDNATATLYYLENHSTDRNPLTTYLLATLLNRRGDHSNARILLSRLEKESSHGNALLVHHRGKIPLKKSTIAPASIVSAAMLEQMLAGTKIKPSISTLAGVPIPALESYHTLPSGTVQINGQRNKPTVSFNISEAAEAHLDKEMPFIATRAAARILLRRGVVASTKKDASPLVDLTMFISNIVTQADTRSWAMLPASIDLYHLQLEPGEHSVQIGLQNATFTVMPKQLSVIEIFEPSSEKIHVITQEKTTQEKP